MSVFVWATCLVAVFPALLIAGFLARLLWTALYLGWCAGGDAIHALLTEDGQ